MLYKGDKHHLRFTAGEVTRLVAKLGTYKAFKAGPREHAEGGGAGNSVRGALPSVSALNQCHSLVLDHWV